MYPNSLDRVSFHEPGLNIWTSSSATLMSAEVSMSKVLICIQYRIVVVPGSSPV